jgi:hypothetical protein
MESLSATQTKILLSLGRYKFLTISQMVRLEVATQRSNITANLSKLKQGKYTLVGQINFPFIPHHGRCENMYYLKPRAKELLRDELFINETTIKVPLGSSVAFTSDYWHRKYTIDSFIALDLEAKDKQETILWFDYYFDKLDKASSGTNAKNKIDLGNGSYIVPDGVFVKQTADKQELWLLELFNDSEANRPYETLVKHREALILGSPSEKYHFTIANKVLCIFMNENVYKKVKERFEKDERFENFKEYFDIKMKTV